MKSYLKFLSRNKLYTVIEAVGLAVSLAFVIIIGSYAWQQWAVTRENPDRERIYVLGLPKHYGLTYGFKSVLEERFPEVEVAANVTLDAGPTIQVGDQQILVEALCTDKSFFDIFPYYRFIEGTPEILLSNTACAVSETFARKYDIKLGQVIGTVGGEMTVEGIVADFSGTLIPYKDFFYNQEARLNRYNNTVPFDHYGGVIPIVKLREGTDPEAFKEKVEALCKEVYPNFFGTSFFEYLEMTRLDKVFFNQRHTGQFNEGDLQTLRLLALVGLLLLLSSIFNYINLNTALTGKRAKEMATRRLLGSDRSGIIFRQIRESVVFTGGCMGVALLLAVAFTPTMNALINNPDIPVQIVFSAGTVIVYALLAIVVGVIAGWLPALLSSRYQPIDIVKGTFRWTDKMVFSKVFIVLQGALAVFLISMALVMEAQYRKSLSRPMHADIDGKYYILTIQIDEQDGLRDALAALPCVKRLGRTNGAPGGSLPGGQFSTTHDGNEILYRLYRMDTTVFSMLKLEKLKDFSAPLYGSVWFGDAAFRATGFDDDYHDISQTLAQRTMGCNQVAGVFADFPNRNDNTGEEEYQIISILPTELVGLFGGGWLMEVTGDLKEAKRQIRAAYDKWCKEYCGGLLYEPDDDYYLTDHLRDALRPMRNNMRLLEVFMLLAILIALLGLLAMSAHFAGQNARSIAIRKVFGGTVDGEMWRNVREYMVLVSISCAIGIPIAVWAAQRYLETYIYRLKNYGWLFLMAVILTFAMAFGSVLWQVLKAAKTNPAIELKKE